MALDTRETFIAVRKNGDGDLREFKTSSGRVLNYEQALEEVKAGAIAGVNVFKGRDGEMYIRGDADGDPSKQPGQPAELRIGNPRRPCPLCETTSGFTAEGCFLPSIAYKFRAGAETPSPRFSR